MSLMAKRRPAGAGMTAADLDTLIRAAGLNQTTAAAALGVSRRTVIRWLRGDTPISAPNALYIRTVIKPRK